ncbi:MAG TPA: phosphotransferase [Gaiellaceae bacterium]
MSETELLEFVTAQRWFGAKGREAIGASVLDRTELEGGLAILLVEVRYATGSHDVYQLVIEDPSGDELLGTPELALSLARLLQDGGAATDEPGTLEFFSLGNLGAMPLTARAVATEQSNSSVVLDERLVLKVYRRLEAGVNPELELLRFLALHEFSNVPELLGWWNYNSPLMETTLGTAQRFVPDAVDGWSLAMADLPARPEAFLEPIARLGEVIGAMHAVLASDTEDPAFAPEDASPEMLALLRATLDDEIQGVFEHLPADETVAPIAGCGDAVRDLLGELTTIGSIGKVTRHHGDLHLGQALRAEGDWFLVDFEGEPARSLAERRVKRSPLRDVAGMLRSFAYACRVAGCKRDEVEQRARDLFLSGYLPIAESAGILPAAAQVERLIEIFELEKAVYELRYELSHRPDWVHIPVAGIESLLAHTSS